MAHLIGLISSIPLLLLSGSEALNTCPGFPGYCSESFPGQTCNVVCSLGRNNVPLCQDDGTWTDIPRCIEHEPGVPEQIPGICPGISGYCAQGFLHQKCQFDCATGPDIDSVCSSDGTWIPYPTCEGDLRETRDGCDGCPGPAGRARNRTAEALAGVRPSNRVPKTGSFSTNRQQVPSFAGSTKFGKINSNQGGSGNQNANRFFVGDDGTIKERPSLMTPPQRQSSVAQRQQAAQRQQVADERQQAEAERQLAEARRQQAEAQRQLALERQQAAARRQQQQQQTFRQPQQQQQPQQQFQQGLNTFRPGSPSSQPLTGSLFNQIKNSINAGHRLRAQQEKQQPQQPQQQQPARRPLPVSNFLPEIDEALLRQQQQLEQQQLEQRQLEQRQQQQQLEQRRQQQQQFQQRQQQDQQQFGVFETVNLGGPAQVQQPRSIQRSAGSSPPTPRQTTNPDFFGEFPTVNLQG